MGERYRKALQDEIRKLGAGNLRVFVNEAGLSPEYRKHLGTTLGEAGVAVVKTRGEANFLFEGECSEEPVADQLRIVAFIRNGELTFRGSLA
jgi:hypothetical protein